MIEAAEEMTISDIIGDPVFCCACEHRTDQTFLYVIVQSSDITPQEDIREYPGGGFSSTQAYTYNPLRNSVGVTPTTRRKTCAKAVGLV